MAKKSLLKMVKPMLNKGGFTMIETLFVLVIICMMFCISMRIHVPQKSDTIKINEMIQFLYQAKLTAMTQKTQVDVLFSKQNIVYRWNQSKETLQLDDNDSFESHQLSFNKNGNIQGAKTLIYYCGSQRYEFVYQIGSGTFYVR